MNMGENTQRIIIWVIIVLFIVSSFGAVAYYVLANRQVEKQQQDLQKAIQQAQVQQNQNQQSNPQSTDQNTTKLTGTKMVGFEPIASVTSLQEQQLTAGTGTATVKAGDTVTVKYVGALAKDGTIFDASSDHQGGTFNFTVGAGQVIKGWDAGIPGMKVGEKRRLLIPASLGYGSNANGGIPANSALVFDVELVKIGS